MARQTDRALADRAVQAAGLMERWMRQIQTDMREHNENTDLRFSHGVVKLPLETIWAMMEQMHRVCAKIRELDGNRTREKIRGSGHP